MVESAKENPRSLFFDTAKVGNINRRLTQSIRIFRSQLSPDLDCFTRSSHRHSQRMRRLPSRLRKPSLLLRPSIPRSGPSSLNHYGPQSLRAPLYRPAETWLSRSISNSAAYSHSHGFGLAPEPTIYALSTAAGRAAIAVIRISGPACVEVQHPPLLYPP